MNTDFYDIPPKINLLPYRMEKKKAINIRFFQILAFTLVLAAGIGAIIHGFFYNQISLQENRNTLLENENQRLDGEINEIKHLKEQIKATLDRKQVVENLQANRSRAVLLFNEIVQPPEGVFYKSLRQTGEKVSLVGIASSNVAVSELMRKLEQSPTLNEPQLIETKAISDGTKRLIEFSVNAKLVDLAKAMEEKNKKNKVNGTSMTPDDFSTPENTIQTLRRHRQEMINRKLSEQK